MSMMPTNRQVESTGKVVINSIVEVIPFMAGALGAGLLSNALKPAGVIGDILVPVLGGLAAYQGAKSRSKMVIQAGAGVVAGWGFNKLGGASAFGGAVAALTGANMRRETYSQAYMARPQQFSQAFFARPSETYSQSFLAGFVQ